MSLYFASLNSGSNGNCYYIGSETDAVLVDAGISCREVNRRMTRLGLDIKKVRAIFISHEHSDHTRGVAMLSRKWKIPVYITTDTLKFSGLYLDKGLIVDLSLNGEVTLGDLTILPFAKTHDAVDPCSFTIGYRNTTVGVFTDIGRVCDEVIKHFSVCNAAFLEANYDAKMLHEGNYPWHLKQRIRGGKGHISNDEALDLFKRYRSPQLSHLLLSHLSQNNNCPILVKDLFDRYAGNTTIAVASRFEESLLYHVTGHALPTVSLPKKTHAPQLELFA